MEKLTDFINRNTELCVIIVACILSELMPFITKIKSNGIVHALINIIKLAIAKLKGKK